MARNELLAPYGPLAPLEPKYRGKIIPRLVLNWVPLKVPTLRGTHKVNLTPPKFKGRIVQNKSRDKDTKNCGRNLRRRDVESFKKRPPT